jgi:hypothetical protein
MAKLTSDVKAEIKAELDKWAEENESVIADNKQVLADLTFYKWVLRAIFAIAFGGTLAGILAFPSIIDKFVVGRVKVIEDLVIANESYQAGDFRSASDSISSFLSGLGTEAGKPWDLSKLSDPQKRLFFSTLVQILSVNADYDPTALTDFAYKDRWRAMLADPAFPRLFSSDSTGYSSSMAQNWAMGADYLRYAETASDLAQAYRFINHVNTSAKSTDKTTSLQSGSPIIEGLVLALQEKRGEAAMTMAGDALVSNYNPYDLTFKKASNEWLLGTSWGPVFDRLSTKFGKLDTNDVCSLMKAAYLQAFSAQTEDLKTPAARTAFLKTALDYYSQIQKDIKNKDFDRVRGMIDGIVTDTNIFGMTQLDAAHMSARIYQVFGGFGTPPAVVVRFFPVNSTNDPNVGDSCLGHPPETNHEAYWVFRKNANSPDHEWRIMPMPAPRSL